MIEGAEEENHLIDREYHHGEIIKNPSDALLMTTNQKDHQATLKALFEFVFDWSPFVVVQLLGNGAYSLPLTFLIGTILAVFVIFYSCLGKTTSKSATKKTQGDCAECHLNYHKLKVMDVGQFVLFGSFFVMALIADYAAKYIDSTYMKNVLFLWFNPLTIGGIAFIMYISMDSPRVCRRRRLHHAILCHLPHRAGGRGRDEKDLWDECALP